MIVTPPREDGVMTTQLIFDTTYDEFRLDQRTREIGRAGIAAARQALADAARRVAARELADGVLGSDDRQAIAA